MKLVPSILDVVVSPMEEFIWTMQEGGWVIALAVLLVIGAAAGLFIFSKKKKNSKEDQK